MSDSGPKRDEPHERSDSIETTSVVADSLPSERVFTLTPSQRDILAAIAQGEANKSIARIVGVGEDTVKKHVSKILKKLEVPNRVAAAVAYRDYLARIQSTDENSTKR
jgi:DNA-binding NarL/FixJ family response regulator